jgi:hypothetical protein
MGQRYICSRFVQLRPGLSQTADRAHAHGAAKDDAGRMARGRAREFQRRKVTSQTGPSFSTSVRSSPNRTK